MRGGRFVKGQSGNPKGRPKARRPNVSAFDIIFDKKLSSSQGGVEQEISVDEALQLQTYQAALKGSKMAVRAVLKMISKREAAVLKTGPTPVPYAMDWKWEEDPRNADDAMLLLGITVPDPKGTGGFCKYGKRMKMSDWAAQAGISRPGRRVLETKDMEGIKMCALNPQNLKWSRGSR